MLTTRHTESHDGNDFTGPGPLLRRGCRLCRTGRPRPPRRHRCRRRFAARRRCGLSKLRFGVHLFRRRLGPQEFWRQLHPLRGSLNLPVANDAAQGQPTRGQSLGKLRASSGPEGQPAAPRPADLEVEEAAAPAEGPDEVLHRGRRHSHRADTRVDREGGVGHVIQQSAKTGLRGQGKLHSHRESNVPACGRGGHLQLLPPSQVRFRRRRCCCCLRPRRRRRAALGGVFVGRRPGRWIAARQGALDDWAHAELDHAVDHLVGVLALRGEDRGAPTQRQHCLGDLLRAETHKLLRIQRCHQSPGPVADIGVQPQVAMELGRGPDAAQVSDRGPDAVELLEVELDALAPSLAAGASASADVVAFAGAQASRKERLLCGNLEFLVKTGCEVGCLVICQDLLGFALRFLVLLLCPLLPLRRLPATAVRLRGGDIVVVPQHRTQELRQGKVA
mmetsp:Transcript_19276/g.49756  ORF Transcript_19276/g.49756 Transcript_19276/m.49756 type:complete len:447 (-) Transcript_19276:146-1486(-)